MVDHLRVRAAVRAISASRSDPRARRGTGFRPPASERAAARTGKVAGGRGCRRSGIPCFPRWFSRGQDRRWCRVGKLSLVSRRADRCRSPTAPGTGKWKVVRRCLRSTRFDRDYPSRERDSSLTQPISEVRQTGSFDTGLVGGTTIHILFSCREASSWRSRPQGRIS